MLESLQRFPALCAAKICAGGDDMRAASRPYPWETFLRLVAAGTLTGPLAAGRALVVHRATSGRLGGRHRVHAAGDSH